ncbi:hypothetical protein [Nocardia nova]|uniref:hypothetical protein n=1 Tax=Nocardia nova TaxID=37330 RepID=UPI0027388198|nr:hypothetical protein [Nocardia nova]
MFTNPIDVASIVSRWTSLGVDLPKDLAKAIDLFDTVQWIETGHRPVLDVNEMTPANAEDTIRKYAAELALTRETTDSVGSRSSALSDAKRGAVDLVARSLIRAAADAVDAIRTQVEPDFADATKAYADAAAKLPDNLTADVLVAAGGEVVDAYQAAKDAAARIQAFTAWLNTTNNLPGHAAARVDRVLSVFAPGTVAELAALDAAASKNADPAERAIDAVLLAGAREGIAWGLNTPAEAYSLRSNLEHTPVAR